MDTKHANRDVIDAARKVWTAYNRGDPQAFIPDAHLLDTMASASYPHVREKAVENAQQGGVGDEELTSLGLSVAAVDEWREELTAKAASGG